MVAKRFQELVCWQLAHEVKLRVYEVIARPEVVPDGDFCFQIRKSARASPAHMAEGFGRFWPADFARFLTMAKASLNETQNHLKDARDSKYITEDEFTELFNLADRAIGASVKLIKYLDREAKKRRARR